MKQVERARSKSGSRENPIDYPQEKNPAERVKNAASVVKKQEPAEKTQTNKVGKIQIEEPELAKEDGFIEDSTPQVASIKPQTVKPKENNAQTINKQPSVNKQPNQGKPSG